MVPMIACLGLINGGTSLPLRIANNGHTVKIRKLAVANNRCAVEELVWLGVVTTVKPIVAIAPRRIVILPGNAKTFT
jgi:hypothetical protein